MQMKLFIHQKTLYPLTMSLSNSENVLLYAKACGQDLRKNYFNVSSMEISGYRQEIWNQNEWKAFLE